MAGREGPTANERPRRSTATEEEDMANFQSGQCGNCIHFGTFEQSGDRPSFSPTADQAFKTIEHCEHPDHAAIDLKVTPISGCADFVAIQG
jgi:hypothetical protein